MIDDIEGIARFSEQWRVEKDAAGKITKEYKVDSYEIGEGDKKKTVKFLSFIPELGFPGSVLRFIRLQIGKRYKVIGTNEKGHQIWGYVQSPIRHHIIAMTVQYLNFVGGYFFLRYYLGSDLAFASCLLFSVNPLTTQVVGWISGLSYSLCMLLSLAVLNIATYSNDYHVSIPLVVFFTFCSGVTLYIGCFTWIILLFLGLKWAAFASGIIGTFILFWKGTETKAYRVNAFKEQNMAHTTFLNWRKPIVMMKTFFYYLQMIILPIRLGLYHTWGYFYEDPIERIDWLFWAGLSVVAGMALAFYEGGFAIRLGLVWFLAYFFLFTNFITAQQFVADRYVVVPQFGICIILAKLLYPTPLFWVLLGLYAMRTFMHLPTFKNEIDYYLSNFLNFRKSEVSLGNLGVAYMNQGMPGSAVDTWQLATKINPFYDVAWYNLYSIFRANGRHPEALNYLKNCMKAKIIHFKDRWQEELVKYESSHLINPVILPQQAGDHLKEAETFFKSGDKVKEKEILIKFLEAGTEGLPTDIIEQVKKRISEI